MTVAAALRPRGASAAPSSGEAELGQPAEVETC
jgi:hypothetical protein